MTNLLTAQNSSQKFTLSYNENTENFEIQKNEKLIFETDIPITALTQFLKTTDGSLDRVPSSKATIDFLRRLKELESDPIQKEKITIFYKTLHDLSRYEDFETTKNKDQTIYTFRNSDPKKTIKLKISPDFIDIEGFQNSIKISRKEPNGQSLKQSLEFLKEKFFEDLEKNLPQNPDAYPQGEDWIKKFKDYSEKFKEAYAKDKNTKESSLTWDKEASKIYYLRISYNPKTKKIETEQETISFQKPDRFEPLRIKEEKLSEDTYQKTTTTEDSLKTARLQALITIFQRPNHTAEENFKIFEEQNNGELCQNLKKICEEFGGLEKTIQINKLITDLRKQNIPNFEESLERSAEGYTYEFKSPNDPNVLKIHITKKETFIECSLKTALWSEDKDFQNSYKRMPILKVQTEHLAKIIKESLDLQEKTYPLLKEWDQHSEDNKKSLPELAKTLREHIKKGRFFDIPKTKIIQISYYANQNTSKFERLTKTFIDVVQSTPKQKNTEEPIL